MVVILDTAREVVSYPDAVPARDQKTYSNACFIAQSVMLCCNGEPYYMCSAARTPEFDTKWQMVLVASLCCPLSTADCTRIDNLELYGQIDINR